MLPERAQPAPRPFELLDVVARPHPFRCGLVQRTVRAGLTIEQILAETQPDPVLRAHAIIYVDDWLIPRERWHCVRPRAGRRVTIAVRPSGGGGGGQQGGNQGQKNALRIVALIAVIAISIYAPYAAPAGSAFAAGTAGGSALSAGIAIGGGVLVNALIPPPTGKLAQSGQVQPTFGVAGGRNDLRRFGPVPRALGQHRMTPPLGALSHTEIVGEDQYLRMLVVWGYGPLGIGSLKIGETPITEFEDVEIETKAAEGEIDEPLTLYPDQVTEEPLDIVLVDGSEEVRRSAPDADELSIDLVFPDGLIQLRKSGDQDFLTVTIELETRLVGESEWHVRDPIVVHGRTTSLISRGRRIKVTPRGQYDVRLRRLAVIEEVEETEVSECHWTALRTITDEDPIVLSGLARTAIRIRASDQLSGVVDTLNGVTRSVLPDWDSGSETWIIRETRNPASMLREVLQGAANARPLTDEQIDLEQLQHWHELCEANSWFYDAIVDYSTSVLDQLREIAAVGRATPALVDDRWTVLIDEPQTTPVQFFTPRNSWGFSAVKSFPAPPHAFRVRFLNRLEGYHQDEVIVYADGYDETNATRFEGLELPGVTGHQRAWELARYHLAVALLRPEEYSFSVDIEHFVCTRGDLIRVAHDVPLWGLGWGRIKSVVGGGEDLTAEDGEELLTEDGDDLLTEGAATGIVLDERITMDVGRLYAVRARRSDGTSVASNVLTEAGETDTLTFDGAPLDPPPERGDLAMFGARGLTTTALIVKAIIPGPDNSARLVCVDEAPGVHTAGDGPIPPFDTRISPPPGTTKPLVISIRSDEQVLIVGTDGVLRPRILVSLHADGSRPLTRIQDIISRYRVAGIDQETESSAPWQRLVSPPDASEISLTEVEEGVPYELQHRYRYIDASPGPWSALRRHTVIGLSTPPPDVEDVSIDQQRLHWRYPEPPPDFGGFLIRLLPGFVTPNWALGIPAHVGIIIDAPQSLAAVPPGEWTVMLKAVDVGGNESVSPAVALLTVPEPILDAALDVIDLGGEGWPGDLIGGSVDAGEVVADDTSDYLPTPDALYLEDPDADYLTSEATEMVYETAITLPSEAIAGDLVRLVYEIEGIWTIEYALMDEIATVGYRPWAGDIDAGAVLAGADPRLVIRVTTAGGGNVGRIVSLEVVLDLLDVVERLEDVAISDSGTRLPITRTYRAILAVQLTIIGSGEATARLVDKDPGLGPMVHVLDFGGSQIAGTVDALVQGY